MQLMRSTLLLFCAVAFFTSPASARPARHHAGLSHHHHHQRLARQVVPADANVFAAQPDRHAVNGASVIGFWNAPAPVAGVQPSVRHRRISPTAANSFASAPVSQAVPSRPSFGGGGSVVAEARRWIGGNPTGRSSLWCGNFMNFVLERTGHQGSSSNMARSFASYGRRVSGPEIGAIAVMSRGKRGGHVGVVSGIDASGNPIIISGNHNRRVAESTYPRGRIYAYVMP